MSTAKASRAPKKPAARKRTPARKPEGGSTSSRLTLEYRLAELPSAQHRAGLAGLVAMLAWLERLPGEKPGTARFVALEEMGATVELDEEGLRRLFDELYAATLEERKESKRRDEEPPLREVDEEVRDAKGKLQRKHFFIYEVPIPRVGLLASWDPTCSDGRTGAWVKLWRDMLWQTLRGKPATRQPFEARARRVPTRDAEEAWKALTRPGEASVPLSSTDFLGAMERSPDNVPFSDRPRFQFLLHFWPLMAQVYVPQRLSVDAGRVQREHHGYALVVPDVARLRSFCEELALTLHQRGADLAGFRPREALVDLATESALAFGQRLRESMLSRMSTSAFNALVLGYEVFHLGKEGNNIRLYGASRIAPTEYMLEAYEVIRKVLWDPLFRRTRLLNILEGRAWYIGFDRIASTFPYEATFGAPYFRHDARESFAVQEREAQAMSTTEPPAPEQQLELLVLNLTRSYVYRKLRNRGHEWDAVKDKDPRSQERKNYDEAKERIARDAFLAVRSRTGQDFITYFAGTLCSIPQRSISPKEGQEFILVSRALHEECEKVRTLTLLALSAVG